MAESYSQVGQQVKEGVYGLAGASKARSRRTDEHLDVAYRFSHTSLDNKLRFKRVFSLISSLEFQLSRMMDSDPRLGYLEGAIDLQDLFLIT